MARPLFVYRDRYGTIGRMTNQHNRYNEPKTVILRLPHVDDALVHPKDKINDINLVQIYRAIMETPATAEYGVFLAQRSEHADTALAGRDRVTPNKLRVYERAPYIDYLAGALSMYKVLKAQMEQEGKVLPAISIDAQVTCLESLTACMRPPMEQQPALIREQLAENNCGGEVFLNFISQSDTLVHRMGRAETALLYATEMGRYAII